MTHKTYGNLPENLGLVDISPVEMMCWLYCPISTPDLYGSSIIPENLLQFWSIIERARKADYDRFCESYVYLTAKTLYVEGQHIGNRPGWHSDGFGTTDLNYIWYDRAPTEFLEGKFTIPEDCDESMAEMERLGSKWAYQVYPNKHLLRLDETVIHRSPVKFAPGMRTFVKVSISDSLYNLAGNSINHELDIEQPTHPRHTERNHPRAK